MACAMTFGAGVLNGDEIDVFFDSLARLRIMAEHWFITTEPFTAEEDEERLGLVEGFFGVGRKSGFTDSGLTRLLLSDLDGFGG